jgi:hypothetical protein
MQAKQALFTARRKVSLQPITVGEPDENQLLVETLYTAISPGTERASCSPSPTRSPIAAAFPSRLVIRISAACGRSAAR